MNFLLNERFTYKYAFIKGFRRTKHRVDATSGTSARFQIWRHISVSCPCARRRIYSWTESSRFVWAQIFVGFVHSEQIDSSSRLFQVRDQFQKIIIQYLSYFSFKKKKLTIETFVARNQIYLIKCLLQISRKAHTIGKRVPSIERKFSLQEA